MVKIPQHKITKQDIFMFLSPKFFVKSGKKTFVTAVFANSYKLIEKIRGDKLENSLFVRFIVL